MKAYLKKICRETTNNVDVYQPHLVDLALVKDNTDKEYDFGLVDIENQALLGSLSIQL